MNVGFITMEKADNRRPHSVGSSRIRGSWVWKYWDEAEEWMVGKEYDVLIFQKAYWKRMMELFDGIKIFDLCDPDWLEPRPVIEIMDHCDAMTTSTEALAEYVRKFIDKPVVCIPDRVDLEVHQPRGKHEGMAKKIGWFGYQGNQHYLDKTIPFLIERELELVVISNAPFVPQVGYNGLKFKNIIFDKVWDIDSVHENLKLCDMVLLPSTHNEDYRGKFKSNNKVLSSWALGLPVVIEPEDLDKFMSSEERNKEVELRGKEIKEKWDVKLSVGEYKKLIEIVGKNRTLK